MKLLCSPFEIRQALRSELTWLVREFDLSPSERTATSTLKTILAGRLPWLCVACGTGEERTSAKVEAAHIRALEAGGTTQPDNLVPLCRRSRRRINAKLTEEEIDGIGCHELYDYAKCASAAELRELRDAWNNSTLFTAHFRNVMVERLKMSHITTIQIGGSGEPGTNVLVQRGHWKRAHESITANLRIAELGGDHREVVKSRIELIKVNRGRGLRNGLKNALAERSRLLGSVPEIPRDFASWFYYESAYTLFQAGYHQDAIKNFRLSLQHIDKTERPTVWYRTVLGMLECVTPLPVSTRPPDWSDFSKDLHDFLSSQAPDNDDAVLGALRINYLINRVRASITVGEVGIAHEELRTLEECYDAAHIDRGASQLTSIEILVTAAVLLSTSGSHLDANRALQLLSRYVKLRIQGAAAFPLGARTVLATISNCLKVLGEHERAEAIWHAAQRIRDGTSWLAPYIAACEPVAGP